MENKYYTPEPEEFRVGFRYEFCHPNCGSNGWQKYDTPQFESELEDCCFAWQKDCYRVKYLDKSDIESLGFKLTNETRLDNHGGLIPDILCDEHIIYRKIIKINDVNGEVFFSKTFDLTYDSSCNFIQINTNLLKNSIMFYGKIKNISELEVLLKQLNIAE